MNISLNWLRRYLADLPPVPELVQKLTFSGIEVEAVHDLSALSNEIVSARILSSEHIEGSDHLSLCMVDYGGSEPIQVVCGAPNCRSGIVTILALPGASIKDLIIKKTKLKGVESFGMLCSERELGISDTHSGIVELDSDTQLGLSANVIYELPDTILELEITPNRSDLLGYIGIARDLSATLGCELITPSILCKENVKDDLGIIDVNIVHPELCPRYTARIIDGVKVADSPLWLKTALIKSGLRPINNIVDITNYVMLETGHPLHAFDYHKLTAVSDVSSGKTIHIRPALPGERFTALDGKDYILDAKDLVVADDNQPVALAGVIGGKDSAIGCDTTTIVLESATFNPQSIRATAYKHKISTDSSYRFERHLSEEAPEYASHRAALLISSIATGCSVGGLCDSYPKQLVPLSVSVRPSRFKQLIGFPISSSEIINYLRALGCQLNPGTEKAAEALSFLVPHYRKDLTREADLIEELARIAGFEKIPQKSAVSQIMDRHAHRLKRYIADHFTISGFHEMLNFSFTDPSQLKVIFAGNDEVLSKQISLINPQSSNQSVMRIHLLPQMLENLAYNINHGERNPKIFEMASVYHRNGTTYEEPTSFVALLTGMQADESWKSKSIPIDQPYIKGLAEDLFDQIGIQITTTGSSGKPWLVSSDSIAMHSGGFLCASLGRIRSDIAEHFDIDIHLLKQDIWMIELEIENLVCLTRNLSREFAVINKYPHVIRDISFVIDTSISYHEIVSAIMKIDSGLIKWVSVFDEYRGKQVPEGKRSLSLHVFIQDDEKTLTDDHIEHLLDNIINMLKKDWQITMR